MCAGAVLEGSCAPVTTELIKSCLGGQRQRLGLGGLAKLLRGLQAQVTRVLIMGVIYIYLYKHPLFYRNKWLLSYRNNWPLSYRNNLYFIEINSLYFIENSWGFPCFANWGVVFSEMPSRVGRGWNYLSVTGI